MPGKVGCDPLPAALFVNSGCYALSATMAEIAQPAADQIIQG